MIYDGAGAYIRVADQWTGFFLGDPGGPRGPNDPLWPLDALFGVSVPAGPYRALSQLPAEVWLDADGLARRIAVSADPLTPAVDAQTWAIAELWDFGVAVDIEPPRPEEVAPPREAYRDRPASSAG